MEVKMEDNPVKKVNMPVNIISRKYLITSFALFVLAVLVLGFYVYERFKNEILKGAEEEIVSVTNLKIQEIERWREERMRNLTVIQNEVFGERVKRTLLNPDNKQIQTEMINFFIRFQENYGYERICLHDLEGKEFLRTSETEVDEHREVSGYFDRIFGKKEIVFENFYFDEKQKKMYLPVISGQFDFKNDQAPLAVIISRVDPEDFLKPLLKSWPNPRKTADLELVRKEEGFVVFLNPVEGSEITSLKNRISINENSDIPESKAVSGFKGLYLSSDIQGKKVLSYIQPVPGTEWFIVAKIDTDEIFYPLRGIALTIWGIIFLLITLFATVIVFILKFQRYSYYKEIAKGAKALKESELRFKGLIEFGADGILLGSHDGFITEVNEMACSIIGMKREELIGKFVTAVPFTKESLDRAPLRFDLLKEGRTVVNEREILRPDGSIIYLEMKTKMMADGSYQSIFRDVTEKKNFENRLREFNAELERKVAERTRQLELANKELESFSYSVSHDLRAPVRHIIGFTDMFLKDNPEILNERSKETFSKITSSAHRMEMLIDDLLMLSRTGRQELIRTKFNMSEVVKSVMAEYKNCKDNRTVQTDVEELPVIYADRNLITIVWENLIDNACKYTKGKDPAKIAVSCVSEENEFVFSIKDNGAGFDPEYTDKLFGVFQRLHLEKDFSGTGIGLANVRRIISRHGGRTWAESEGENKGAAFYFSFQKITI
jgi:PAS domain S-box-containing protein